MPAIVKISVQHRDGTASEGTGFFINENTIVSCHHVLDNARTVKIETSDGQKFTADSVVSSNRLMDLIKFTVKEKTKKWLKLSDRLPAVGESVYVIGNPDDFDFSITNGIISGIRILNSIQVIQNTAPISSGSSGSPVLNRKGIVVGMASITKYNGQNLNFASTSINLINLPDDNSIQEIKPSLLGIIVAAEMDSIENTAKLFFQQKDYKNALYTIIPITRFADSTKALQFLEFIGDCHFYLEDYAQAVQYFEPLAKKLYSIINRNNEVVFSYAQTLQKVSVCYFMLGDHKGAIDCIAKAVDVCKIGLLNDIPRKEIYKVMLQTDYLYDATYKFSENRDFEACLSWKIAKNYGYNKDELGFEAKCK